MINKMTTSDSVLILDDEPHLLQWLEEYLNKKGCNVIFATNVQEAFSALNNAEKFRMMILDLNVPASGEYSAVLAQKGAIFENYRGLYIAERARNLGYRRTQVIVYSVHDSDDVRLITDQIGVTYITKGRPRVFKTEIDYVLSFDPEKSSTPSV